MKETVESLLARIEHRDKNIKTLQTLEIHVSDNNGKMDQHTKLTEPPFWWDTFQSANISPNTVIFSEGNHRERNATIHT